MTGLFVICLLVGVAFGLPCCECADNDGSQIINCCGTLDISENSCYCDGEPCEPCTPVGEGDCTSTHTTVEERYQVCSDGCCTIPSLLDTQNCCDPKSSIINICIFYSQADNMNYYYYNAALAAGGYITNGLIPTLNASVYESYYFLSVGGQTSSGWVQLTLPPAPPAPPAPQPSPAPGPTPCPTPRPESEMPPVWLLVLVSVLGAIALGSTIGLVIVCVRHRKLKSGYAPLESRQ